MGGRASPKSSQRCSGRVETQAQNLGLPVGPWLCLSLTVGLSSPLSTMRGARGLGPPAAAIPHSAFSQMGPSLRQKDLWSQCEAQVGSQGPWVRRPHGQRVMLLGGHQSAGLAMDRAQPCLQSCTGSWEPPSQGLSREPGGGISTGKGQGFYCSPP